MGWRDTITNGADAKPSWRDTIKAPESVGNSAGRGGAFEAAKDWFTNTGEGMSPSKRVEFGGYPAAALRQFGAGASGDWKDEAQGFLEKAGGGDYVKGRDEARQIEAETEKQYPTTSKIAHLAGNYVSPITKLGIPIASGLMGLGASKADLTKGDAEENTQALRDTVWSALFGKALSNAGEKVAPWLDKAKTAFAGRHIRMTPAIRRAVGREAADAAANEAVDSGAIQWGHKVDDTADNLKGLVEKVGAEKGAMVDAATKKIDPLEVAKQIEDQVIAPLEKRSSEAKEAAAPLRQKLARFLGFHAPEDGPSQMTAKAIENEKTDVQKGIRWGQDSKAIEREGEQAYAGKLKEIGEGLVDDPNFVPTKEKFGRLKTAQAAADRTASLTDGGGLMGHLTDLNVGHVALEELMKSNPKGLALLAARGLIKGRMSSAGAVSAKAVADAIKRGDLNFVKNLAPVAASGSYGLLKAARDE